ncbi:hypothetical protein ACFQMN_03750 [Halobacillus campisalis]|uniref:Uncharacterized protein n=1 Tax=Halobacillus campisalis TaxID=435909 RepID=A0ABW2K0Y2_9BACI|nr:hypothetical protein [Halobacillus campisalis]
MEAPSLSNVDGELIEVADPYISLEEGKFVISNEAELKEKVSSEDYQSITSSLNLMNDNIEKSENLVHEEESVTVVGSSSANPASNQVSTNTVTAASQGKSGVDYYWWGYKVFFDSYQTRQIRNTLLGGATAAGVANQLSPWFSAPSAAIKAISGAIAAGGTGLAGIIASNDNGNGIWIRVTGYAVYTGIGPQ